MSKFRIAITLTSSLSVDEEYLKLTRDVARYLAEHDFGIVFGGTAYGMMLELAQTYKTAGGTDLVGVMAKDLMAVTKGYVPYDKLDETHMEDSMENRKHKMVTLADAFLILPGGYGTFEELGTMLGGRINKLYDKPIAILNYKGFYDQMLAFFSMMVDKNFSKIRYEDVCLISEDLAEITNYFSNYQPEELADKFV